MLVVGGVQMAAQLVGGGPEFGFEALMAGVFGLLLGWSARHGVPFAFELLYHENMGWDERARMWSRQFSEACLVLFLAY